MLDSTEHDQSASSTTWSWAQSLTSALYKGGSGTKEGGTRSESDSKPDIEKTGESQKDHGTCHPMLHFWMLFHVMFCLYMVGVVCTPVQISCVGNTCGGVTMVLCVATTAACLLGFTTDGELVKRGIRNTEYGIRNKESADYRDKTGYSFFLSR